MSKLGKLSLAIASAGFLVLAAASQAKSVTLEYDSSIGTPGFGPGQLFVPQGIAVNNEGNVYVSNGRGVNPDGSFNPNLGNKVEIFNPKGDYIGAVGSGGKGPGQFDEPTVPEFSPTTGNLYVGDVYNNNIKIFDPQGNFIKSFGSFTPLTPDRAFFGPSGESFDKAGNLYVGDFTGDKINKYTADGELLGSIGTSGTGLGQLQGPAGLRVSQNTGNIYVADQYNNRVQVLDPSGKGLISFGTKGSGDGQFFEPIGLELDQEDNVYVADKANSRVQVFDKNGKFLTAYGQPALDASGKIVPPPGLTDPPFGKPLDLAPGRFNWTGGTALKDGKLYVGDFFQGRVQVLKVNTAAKVPESTPVVGLGLLAAIAAASTLKKRSSKSVLDLTKKLEKTAV